MKMRVKPLVVDVIEDDGMWLDVSTMTYYDKDSLEPITKPEVDLEKEMSRFIWKYFKKPDYDKDFIAEIDWEHSMKDCARHFYELGKSAKKEE